MPRHLTIDRVLARYNVSESGCWEWLGPVDATGYGKAHSGGKFWRVHRLAYTHMVGAIPDGMMILHKCHNRLCFNPSHLKPGTHDENMADMIAAGRQAKGGRVSVLRRGPKNPNAKLTASQIEELKQLRRAGYSLRQLAARFGITAVHACRVAGPLQRLYDAALPQELRE